MDSFETYAALRARLQQVKRQVDRIRPLIAADRVTADVLRGGIWNSSFAEWMGWIRLYWDLSDPATDVRTIDYGLGLDRAKTQAEMAERNRAKLIAIWRADMENDALAVGTELAALRTSMAACRDWVVANYKTLTTADGIGIDPVTGEAVWQAIPKARLAALETLLSDTNTKLAPLVK